MRIRWLALSAALAALAAGCPRPLNPDERLALAAPAPTLELLRSAGDRAAVVLLVHPGRWPAAARTLQPFVAGDPDLHQAQAVLAAPDLWTALGRILTSGSSGAAWPSRLDGWDPTRPIAIALFEPELNETVLAARVAMPVDAGAPVPPLHHRVLVPATDARALLGSLAELSGLFNWKLLPSAAEIAGLAGGQVYRTAGGGLAALIPEKDRLRIELLDGPDYMSRPSESDMETLSGWLVQPRARANPPVTPALLAAASRDDLVVAHVRPWVFRDLSTQLGAAMVYGAVQQAGPATREGLMLVGLSEVAGGYLQMTPRGAELDDWTFSLDLDAGLRLTGVASLTKLGGRIWAAGRATAMAPSAGAATERLLDASASLDTGAMLAAASIPPALQDVERNHLVFETLARCGIMCHLHYLLRQPVGLVKLVQRNMGAKARVQLPRAVAARLVAIVPGAGPVPVKLAMAASFPAGADTRWLRELISGLPQQDQPAVSLYTDRLADTELIRVGVGLDPRQVFTLEPAGTAVGQVAAFAVDPAALANLVTRFSPAAAAALDKLDSISVRTLLAGRALLGELSVTLKATRPSRPERLPELTGLDWESPDLAAASTKGAGCLESVTREMVRVASAMPMAAPETRDLQLVRAVDALGPPLACALSDPRTAADARQVQFALSMLEARHLKHAWKRTERIQILDQACSQGHARACHLADEARAEPEVELARTTGGCLEPWQEGQAAIVVGADRPEPDAIVAQTRDELRLGPGPLLALDGKLRADRLMALGSALRSAGTSRLGLLVATEQRGPARIPIALGLAPGPAGKSSSKPSKPAVSGLLGALEEADAGDLQAFDLAVLVTPAGVTLRGPGGEVSASEGGLDAAAVAKKLDEVQQTFPSVRLNVLCAADISWKDLAPVLAAAACGADDPTAGRPARPLRLVLDPKALDALIPPWSEAAAAAGSPGPDAGSSAAGLGKQIDPRPKIVPGQVRMGPTLSKEVILRVIRKHQAEMKYCYERELIEDPGLEGKVTIDFTVGPEGRVTEAAVKAGGLAKATLEACLLERVRSWVFPAPLGGGIVKIIYPFVFKSAE